MRSWIRMRSLALLLGVLVFPGAAVAQISVFTDFASFDAATGPLSEIDFENLHSLTEEGITFRDPLDLSTGFCSSPTCQIDPDNPFGSGNIIIALNPGGTIDFPPGTDRTLLDIQGIGSATFTVEVTDFAGSTFTADGQGIPFDQVFLDLTAPDEISRIEVLSTSGGPLGLAAVHTFDASNNLLSEIDFEGLPPDGSCILSVCAPDGPSPPNPMTLDGVMFTDPFSIEEGFCSFPTCQIDPDNPIGNIILALNPGATIDLPVGTRGVMLVIEGMGDNPFEVQVTDFSNNSITASGQAVSFSVAFLGFTSSSGIQQIEVLSVGGTGGPLGLSAVKLFQVLGPTCSGVFETVAQGATGANHGAVFDSFSSEGPILAQGSVSVADGGGVAHSSATASLASGLLGVDAQASGFVVDPFGQIVPLSAARGMANFQDVLCFGGNPDAPQLLIPVTYTLTGNITGGFATSTPGFFNGTFSTLPGGFQASGFLTELIDSGGALSFSGVISVGKDHSGERFPVNVTSILVVNFGNTGVANLSASVSFDLPDGVTIASASGVFLTQATKTTTGTNVEVQPVDASTGSSPVTLTFAEITQDGTTGLTTSSSGPPLPSGFSLGDPATYYSLTTTAQFDGSIEVCIDYSGISFGDESSLKLLHFENGVWEDRTSSLDTQNNIICAAVTSLSPFAIVELEEIQILLDIKPNLVPNSIDPNNQGVLPAAILTTSTGTGELLNFDATTVDPLSLVFGPLGARETHNRGHIQDVDGDGDLDLILHFKTEDTGIQCGDTEASLTGETFIGQPILGTDAIQTVGCS